MKRGFTLIELLAVVIILAIVLAIAIPSINGILNNSKTSAFEGEVESIIKAIEIKLANDKNYNLSGLNVANMKEDLEIDNDNYESLSAAIDPGSNIFVEVVGKNEWAGLKVYGTRSDLASVNQDFPTPEACFTFDAGTNTIVRYNDYNDPVCVSDVIIPSKIDGISVLNIQQYAFSGDDITSVVIPDGVTTIGNGAFQENKLRSVVIPSSVTMIDDFAFYKDSLVSVIIPNGVTNIGLNAFNDNQIGYVSLPNTLVTLEAYAFWGNHLKSVTLPNSLTTIGDHAFEENELTSITIPGSVTSMGINAFRLNEIKNVIVQNGVTTIGNGAFQENKVINVTLPNTLTTIETVAFGYNPTLKNITIPSSVTSIGAAAFYDDDLTTVTIPSNVTSIGGFAFEKSSIGVNISNTHLVKVINQTGRSFDWGSAINSGTSGYQFVTGTVTNSLGNVIVSSS